MEKNEVIILIDKLNIYYPGRLKMDNPRKLIEAYYDILKGCDTKKVMANMERHALNSKYVPTIAELGENAKKYVKPKPFVLDMNAGEDWPQ